MNLPRGTALLRSAQICEGWKKTIIVHALKKDRRHHTSRCSSGDRWNEALPLCSGRKYVGPPLWFFLTARSRGCPVLCVTVFVAQRAGVINACTSYFQAIRRHEAS